MGSLVAILVGLASLSENRATRHRHRIAPSSVHAEGCLSEETFEPFSSGWRVGRASILSEELSFSSECERHVFAAQVSPAQLGDVDARRKALTDLLAEQWEYTMRTSPVWASMLGDKRWNDKLEDFSQQAIDKDLQETKKILARFEAIDTAGFPAQDALKKKLIVRNLKMELEGVRFKPWEMPVSQFGGIHIQLPDLVDVLSFKA